MILHSASLTSKPSNFYSILTGYILVYLFKYMVKLRLENQKVTGDKMHVGYRAGERNPDPDS